MPEVSVVLPTYNRDKILPRAMDSVLNQSYGNLELIIVDDCSVDNTSNIVNAYDDDRIKYIRHNENQGGSVARNTGISVAQGKYLAFLDDDDEWHHEKLSKQVEVLESKSEKWVAVYCDAKRTRSGTAPRIREWFSHTFSDRDLKKEGGEELVPLILLREWYRPSGTSTFLVKREIVDSINGFDDSLKRHQDWDFLIRILREGNLAYIDEPLMTKHASNQPSAEDTLHSKKRLLKKYSDEIDKLESNGYDVKGRHMVDVIISHLHAGDIINALKLLSEAKYHSIYRILETIFAALAGIQRKLAIRHA